MHNHVLQSKLWEEFKNAYGTPTVRAGNVLYTKHKIPFTPYYYGYSPRINPFEIDFKVLKESLQSENCVAVQFDVPNITIDDKKYKEALSILENHCTKSPRDEFAKGNFLVDLTKSEEDLFNAMHKKHKYNVKYAQRNGVTVRSSIDKKDFETFFKIYSSTGERQRYYSRSKRYLETIWETFSKEGAVYLLMAEYQKEVLASWMFFTYENVLYYPYGGMLETHKDLHPSCLLGWEAIKFGKKQGCKVFDMWGASEDLSNKDDHYYGFSHFKEKFGATHVVYMSSYDFVVNQAFYKAFIAANSLRWGILNLLK